MIRTIEIERSSGDSKMDLRGDSLEDIEAKVRSIYGPFDEVQKSWGGFTGRRQLKNGELLTIRF